MAPGLPAPPVRLPGTGDLPARPRVRHRRRAAGIAAAAPGRGAAGPCGTRLAGGPEEIARIRPEVVR
nr:hypothetical protein [Actinomycetales bacterium]